jgi:hypothetical protein
MSKTPLLSNKFKKIGWFILVPSVLMGICLLITDDAPDWLNGRVISVFPSLLSDKYFETIDVNLAYTIVGSLIIVGGLLLGFSKEKKEDEFIAKLRLQSLLWAVLVNYTLLLLTFVLVYGMAFFTVMVYNMFTVLLLFIARFNYILYRNTKKLPDAE